jgi:hypothetical protein
MTASNPFVLNTATRFKPLSLRIHSRSPSRSPVRKAQFTAHELDPLLGNLSPESTLQAFSVTEAPSTSGQRYQDALRASIANASTAERALGIKAALAAQKARQWLAEISSWHWPDPKASALGAGFLQPTGNAIGGEDAVSNEEDLYMGSLRAETVRKYEERIDEIKDGLEALDVEDLKEHVLVAHIPSRSRPGTRNGLSEVTTSGSEYGRLGDLTAVITATILQTLPYLAELNMLISIWDVRIAVLFEVPELVQRLNITRAAVEEALKEVRAEKSSSSYTKADIDATKERLQNEVSSLGVRFDKALDLLEGREDSLPNSWIEEMDTIESNFGDWVVEAERRATKDQWRQQKWQPTALQKSNQSARDLEDRSSEGVTDSTILSIDSDQMADHSPQKDTDEHQPSAGHDLLSGHPALTAFKHRPVRKASVKHSPLDPDSHSVEVFPSGPSTADQEDTAAARTMAVQTTATVPPEVIEDPDGHSPQQPPPEVPVMSYSPQQQSRLADLIALNHVKSAEEYQSGFVGRDHDDASAFTAGESVQPEPFPFLSQEPETTQKLSSKKPPLKLDLSSTRHRRHISEVSIADSAFSEAFSDMSNAEIVDARTTQVLASPKINVVDSPFRASRDDLSTFAIKEKPRVQSMHFLGKDVSPVEPVIEGHSRSKSLTITAMPSQFRADHPLHTRSADLEVYADGFSRSQILHRASTASIEVIPKGLVRRIDSNRKNSHETYPVSPIDSNGSPVDALRSLTSTGSFRSVSSTGTERMKSPAPIDLNTRDGVSGYNSQPLQSSSYSEAVATSRAGTMDTVLSSSPAVPRKSSKRQSRDLDDLISSTDTKTSPTSDIDEAPIPLPSTFSPFKTKDHKSSSSSNKLLQSEETLEAKIKDILTSLPTRIHLTSDSDSSGRPAHQSSSDSTRSSTPAPSLTLSPARQDRSSRRSNASNSEVKVYHLIRSGQPRDAPPTKLHVRLVGENGERVMVRVGGGWADLAEYLREYSLHHGKRTIQEGRFEVANLPSSGVKASDTTGSSPIGPSLSLAKTRSASRPDAGLDFGALPALNIGKARRSATAPISAERKTSRSSSPAFREAPPVRPPPVPVIPTSYREEPLPKATTSPGVTTHSPTVTTEVRSRGPSFSTSTFIAPSTPLTAYQAQNRDLITTSHPTIITTSALSTPVSTTPSPSYTPLGAAGPKGGIKNAKSRAATYGSPAASSPESEAWVQGMIGKARQVSAQNNSSHVTTIAGPNNTTNTSLSTPTSRRVSAGANATLTSTPPSAKRSSVPDSTSTPATPDSSRGTQTPSPSPANRDANRSASAEKPRSKSAMGIRRVFLRSLKKADKAG